MPENLTLVGLDLETKRLARGVDDTKKRLDGLERRFDKTKRSGQRLQGTMDGLTKRLGTAAAAYVGFNTAVRGARAVADAVQEFEALETRLATLTQSTTQGRLAFEALVDFARTTPHDIQNVVAAFARLRSVGITPTIGQMRQLGNVASAQATDIESVAAAVTQAAFAETERLKSLGIAAQVSQDAIRLQYDDVVTTIRRTGDAAADARAVLGFVTDLSDSRWGDAMSRQAGTMTTSLSNLRGEWALFLREVGSTGGVTDATVTALEPLLATIRAMTAAVAAFNKITRPGFRVLHGLTPQPIADPADVGPGDVTGPLLPSAAPPPPQAPQEAVERALERRATLLREKVLELTHGAEAATRYRLAVEGASAAEIEQALALARVRDALEEARAAEEASERAMAQRTASIEAALRGQERYLVRLRDGADALADLDFLALAPDAEQLAQWHALTSAIRETETASTRMAAAQDRAASAMAEAEVRAHNLESTVSRLLHTLFSGQSLLAEIGNLLLGIAIQGLSQRIASSVLPEAPVPPAPSVFGGARPGLAGGGPVIHFQQNLSVPTFDQRGVTGFFEENRGLIGQLAVDAITEGGQFGRRVR